MQTKNNENAPMILNQETGELLVGEKAIQFAAEKNIDLTIMQDGELTVFLDFDPNTLPKPNTRTEFVSFMQDWYDYLSLTTGYVVGTLDGSLLKQWWKNYGKDKDALPAHKHTTLKTTKKVAQDIAAIIPMTANEQLGMESIVNAWFFQ